MKGETPGSGYIQTKSGLIHMKWCGVGRLGTGNKAMSLDDVIAWVERHGVLDGNWMAGSAMCCGASPESWLRINHRETYALLMEQRKAEEAT